MPSGKAVKRSDSSRLHRPSCRNLHPSFSCTAGAPLARPSLGTSTSTSSTNSGVANAASSNASGRSNPTSISKRPFSSGNRVSSLQEKLYGLDHSNHRMVIWGGAGSVLGRIRARLFQSAHNYGAHQHNHHQRHQSEASNVGACKRVGGIGPFCWIFLSFFLGVTVGLLISITTANLATTTASTSTATEKQHLRSSFRQPSEASISLDTASASDAVYTRHAPQQETLPQFVQSPQNYTSICLPRVLIGGAMKCGTNEAMRLLSLHPRMRFNICPDHNEPEEAESLTRRDCTPEHYQGQRNQDPTNQQIRYYLWEANARLLVDGSDGKEKDDNIRRFLNRFPDTDASNTVSADKSPEFIETFHTPEFPAVVQRYLPGTKMIFTLCDPAERLVSEYHHNLRNDHMKEQFLESFQELGLVPPPSTFAEFVAYMDETSQLCHGSRAAACRTVKDRYLPKGVYVRGVFDWLQQYSSSFGGDDGEANEQILVIDMEAPPQVNARRMIDFVGGLPIDEFPWDAITPASMSSNSTATTDVKMYRNLSYQGRQFSWKEHPAAMEKLARLYAPFNQRLARLLGEDFPLRWKSTQVGNTAGGGADNGPAAAETTSRQTPRKARGD